MSSQLNIPFAGQAQDFVEPGVPLYSSEEIIANRPSRVFLMDLLPTVPYYTGHLCAALKAGHAVQVTLGATTYSHDQSFFKRMGLHNAPGLLDIGSRLASSVTVLRRCLKLVECLLNLAALTLRFSASKPDIIHVQFLPLVEYHLPIEVWFLKIVQMLGIKLVYTVHNILPHDSGERHRATYERLYALMDGFICHDSLAKHRLAIEFGVSPDRICVIPHGPLFDSESKIQPEQARAKVGLPIKEPVVLWQGIVRPYKGVSFLLKSWKLAQEQGLKATLVIVGTGDKKELNAIRDEVSSLSISSSVRLEFRFVSVEELTTFYRAADILVYPYNATSTSGALMTGIGHGKAIIASALSGFEQLLHQEQNALLVPYGDIAGWAAALTRLAGDVEFRLQLARGVQLSQADTPRWTDIAEDTSRFYRHLLTPRRPQAPGQSASPVT